ncbi:hypothetical protein [Ostreibacterium oceani]|uniref:Type II secretory pathway component PulF n=1 Tax=Ostreibacterium oceani TaxID=2654998 RepID=A0A6N7EVT8_9GAMM|nr:hypothetical protein [Ostreibacterium oceani]MPV85539.1 hypothetical protein [Ostreibacterium oceani]
MMKKYLINLFYAFRSPSTCLDEVSRVVMNSNDPYASLQELKSQLSPLYHRTLTIISRVLDGKQDALKLRGIGIWHCLITLSNTSGIELKNYIGQYSELDKGRGMLRDTLKYNVFYIIYLVFIFQIASVAIEVYRVKSLPVFESYLADFGLKMPALTKAVMNDTFMVIFYCVFVFALFFMLVPLFVKKRMRQLQGIPWYLRLTPFYWFVIYNYQKYRFLLYTKIGYKASDSNAIDHALQSIGTLFLPMDEKILLMMAQKNTQFEAELDERLNDLGYILRNQVRRSDMFLGFFFISCVVLMMASFLIAMYLPIFLLPGVVW